MNDIDFVKRLVMNGGPEIHEWNEVTEWTASIVARRKAGELSDADVVAIRDAFGLAFSLDTMQGFAYQKPHGYAGDFEIIDRIYNEYTAPAPNEKWDIYLQAHPAAKAVRNRKAYFHRLLTKIASRGNPVSVLKIASGPGRSMYEWLNSNSDCDIKFDCIEIDKNAIAHASALNVAHSDKVNFIRMNALKFRPEKTYDLVWAAGIFDYFNDETFVSLFSRLLCATAESGEAVIGNFARGNPSAAYMELLDWNLFHRTADELRALAEKSGASRSKIRIDQEEEGVNLFLHVDR